jgi:hypothetical protein
MANKTFKLFADKMGGRQAAQYVGIQGEIFYDPTTTSLRISDGTTAGGQSLSAGGGADLGDLKISGSTLGTQAESGGWGAYWLYLDPGGESYAGIQIPSVDAQNTGSPLTLYSNKTETSEIQFLTGGGATYTFGPGLTIPGTINGTGTIRLDNTDTGISADIGLFSADDINIVAGDKPSDSDSEGGDINITCGDGGAAGEIDPGSGGGDLNILSGTGGSAGVGGNGNMGGFINITCGTGGSASFAENNTAGAGSNLTLNAGSAGSNDGNTALGNYGGSIVLNAGNATDALGEGGGAIIFNTGLDHDNIPAVYSFGSNRSTPLTYKEAIAALAFTPVTLTTLGTAAAAGGGARAFINDSNVVAAGNFGTVAVSGNTYVVPVYSDGANWRIG